MCRSLWINGTSPVVVVTVMLQGMLTGWIIVEIDNDIKFHMVILLHINLGQNQIMAKAIT